jgi:hypothetical protein
MNASWDLRQLVVGVLQSFLVHEFTPYLHDSWMMANGGDTDRKEVSFLYLSAQLDSCKECHARSWIA